MAEAPKQFHSVFVLLLLVMRLLLRRKSLSIRKLFLAHRNDVNGRIAMTETKALQ